jgi:regulator of sirC expression with transglutaminase-like and TPR domain
MGGLSKALPLCSTLETFTFKSPNMQAIKTELLELLRRNDLLRASLVPGFIQDANFSRDPFVEKLLELSAKVWHKSARVKNDPILQAEVINKVLFTDFKLQGRTEKSKQVIDDPAKYYIHRVLETKMGCPLSLAIIYLSVAEQVGLECECIAVPSYYYIKIKDAADEFYVDPFEHGKFLTPEEFQRKFRIAFQRNRMISANLFEKITTTQLVSRLVQQLKHVYILKGDALTALRAVELLTALFPDSPEITRDRGILYCEMEYFSKAMEDLRFYIQRRPNAEDISEIRKLTTMLKGYREIVN